MSTNTYFWIFPTFHSESFCKAGQKQSQKQVDTHRKLLEQRRLTGSDIPDFCFLDYFARVVFSCPNDYFLNRFQCPDIQHLSFAFVFRVQWLSCI